MNHLAHFYLAGNDRDLIIGNYIADYVKGKQKELFLPGVERGIDMHRAIDYYTDTHPIVKQNVGLLKPLLGRYSSIAIDVIYDHFLSKHWSNYHETDLQEYSDDIYDLLHEEFEVLPTGSRRFLNYMTTYNVLVNYQHLSQLNQVFYGMSTRTKFKSNLEKGVEALELNYPELEQGFKDFFKELDLHFSNWKEEHPLND